MRRGPIAPGPGPGHRDSRSRGAYQRDQRVGSHTARRSPRASSRCFRTVPSAILKATAASCTLRPKIRHITAQDRRRGGMPFRAVSTATAVKAADSVGRAEASQPAEPALVPEPAVSRRPVKSGEPATSCHPADDGGSTDRPGLRSSRASGRRLGPGGAVTSVEESDDDGDSVDLRSERWPKP
jgi:hypothetical protein